MPETREALKLTSVEEGLIRLLRRTPFGNVTVKMARGTISLVDQNNTFKPEELENL